MDTKSLGSLGAIAGVVAVAISIVALVTTFSTSSESPDDEKVGGQRAGLQEFSDGITLGNFDNTSGAQIEWFSGTLDPLSNEEVIFRNTTGKDVYVDYGEVNIVTGETASSTTDVHIFATSTGSIATSADFGTLAEVNRGLIRGVTFGTSTTATTTNSVYASSVGLGNGAVVVPSDWYLILFLKQNTTRCSIAGAAAGACETATSSKRGFNPQYKVRVHY